MISRKITAKVQKVNDQLGVPVKLPTPSVKAQKISGVITTVTGVGAAVTGSVFKSKWVIVSGAVFVIGGVLSYLDAKSEDK